MVDIPQTFIGMLERLDSFGGEAELINYQVVAGPTKTPLIGQSSQWLWCVSRGLIIGGSNGKLFLSEDGKMVIAAQKKRRNHD